MIFLDLDCKNVVQSAVDVVLINKSNFGKVLEDSLVVTLNDLLEATEDAHVVEYIHDCPDDFFKRASDVVRDVIGNGFVRLDDTPYEHPVWRVKSPQFVNKLVKLRGLITRATDYLAKPLLWFYRCTQCQHVTMATDVIKNVRCDKCGGRMAIEHKPEHTVAYRMYVLHDIYDERRDSVELHLFGENVKTVDVGDVVDVVGIVRERRIEVRKQMYVKYYVLGVYAKRQDAHFERIDDDVINYIVNNNSVEYIPKAIAPGIHGLDIVKKAIALQMLSTNTSDTPHRRDRIHILLLGDPAVAKTQLLNAVVNIMPRSFYTVSHGSSSAGLGGAVIRDELSGEFVVDPGVMVVADGSIVAIDEFDKVKEIPVLLEAMERGTVTITKAGKAQFNARTAVLAAANPIGGRYKPNRSLFENFSIPLPLYSRFDLIFVLRDEVDEGQDRAVARAVVQKHTSQNNSSNYSIIRKYILHARSTQVTIDNDVMNYAIEFYVQLRKQNNYVTARQLETILRLAKAHAKLRLADSVVREDVDAAIALFTRALQSQGFTLESFDATLFESGVRSELSELATEVYNFIKTHIIVRENDIYQRFDNVPQEDVKAVLSALMQSGRVYEPRPGMLKAL